jgi:hypothetical protein
MRASLLCFCFTCPSSVAYLRRPLFASATGHTLGEAYADFKNVQPLTHATTILLLDDCGCRGQWWCDGVNQAVAKVREGRCSNRVCRKLICAPPPPPTRDSSERTRGLHGGALPGRVPVAGRQGHLRCEVPQHVSAPTGLGA